MQWFFKLTATATTTAIYIHDRKIGSLSRMKEKKCLKQNSLVAQTTNGAFDNNRGGLLSKAHLVIQFEMPSLCPRPKFSFRFDPLFSMDWLDQFINFQTKPRVVGLNWQVGLGFATPPTPGEFPKDEHGEGIHYPHLFFGEIFI